MSDRRDVERGSYPGVYTPKELAAGEEASIPTDAVGGGLEARAQAWPGWTLQPNHKQVVP